MQNFKDRFEDEIISLAEHYAGTGISVHSDANRGHAAWIGGSMFASFSTFRDMVITKEEYDNMPREAPQQNESNKNYHES